MANYEEFTRTNFLGAMLCTRVAVDTMIPQGGGAIINVTSVGSLNCEDRAPIVYSAAKAAVNSMTKAIAVKYGAQGIRANVLAPGFTHSEKTLQASREVIAPMEQKSAFGRAGDAEEQAQVAVFLAVGPLKLCQRRGAAGRWRLVGADGLKRDGRILPWRKAMLGR